MVFGLRSSRLDVVMVGDRLFARDVADRSPTTHLSDGEPDDVGPEG